MKISRKLEVCLCPSLDACLCVSALDITFLSVSGVHAINSVRSFAILPFSIIHFHKACLRIKGTFEST